MKTSKKKGKNESKQGNKCRKERAMKTPKKLGKNKIKRSTENTTLKKGKTIKKVNLAWRAIRLV